MKFDTAEDRRLYFEKLEFGIVEEGSAEEHARTATLGLFSDRWRLKSDVARIYAAELKYNHEARLPPYVDLHGLLMDSPVFSRLFRLWRREKDYAEQLEIATVLGGEPPTPLKPLTSGEHELLGDELGFICDDIVDLAQSQRQGFRR